MRGRRPIAPMGRISLHFCCSALRCWRCPAAAHWPTPSSSTRRLPMASGSTRRRRSFGCTSASRFRRYGSACSTLQAGRGPAGRRRAARRHDHPAPVGPLPRGAYLLSYRVTSLDAHAVGATLRFGVGVAPAGAVDDGATRWSAWAAVAARWLLYLTALGAVGPTLFGAAVRPPPPFAARASGSPPPWQAPGSRPCCCVSALTGLDLAGLPASALLSGQPWLLAGATSLGVASAMAALGLAGIALGPTPPSLGAAAAAVLVGLSFALTGHAATAPPRWLTGPALGLHVLCAAFWLGSLLPLWWSLRLEPGQAVRVLRRFSHGWRWWPWPCSLRRAARSPGSSSAATLVRLTSTAYGWRLFGKLALVAGLLALAALNRLVLTPALAEAGRDAARRLRLTLAADLVLGLAVLAVTATFPLSPPPRALAAPTPPRADGITVVASGPDGQAVLTLMPGRAGTNRLEAWVTDRDGAPRLAREATVAWAMPAAGIEPERRVAATAGAGRGRGPGHRPAAGGRLDVPARPADRRLHQAHLRGRAGRAMTRPIAQPGDSEMRTILLAGRRRSCSAARPVPTSSRPARSRSSIRGHGRRPRATAPPISGSKTGHGRGPPDRRQQRASRARSRCTPRGRRRRASPRCGRSRASTCRRAVRPSSRRAACT